MLQRKRYKLARDQSALRKQLTMFIGACLWNYAERWAEATCFVGSWAQVMPFKKHDGQYYFEAVEALSKDHFPIEHQAQFLALYPLCTAKIKEIMKRNLHVPWTS